MTRYCVRVKIIPTEKNDYFPVHTEYYGNRETYMSRDITPSDGYMFLFGFNSKKAAEAEKERRLKFYNRDESTFGTFTHEVEVVSMEI